MLRLLGGSNIGEYEELSNALDTCKNEREIAKYLKKHLILIRNACNYSWNWVRIVDELSLGGNYRVDYAIISANSGFWEVTLIEMQSHKNKIFRKNGDMSSQLNEAQRQIMQWKAWIEEHDQQFREQIAKIVGAKTPAYCSNADIHMSASSEIRDVRTYIKKTYMVLIGRKEYLSQEKNKLRNHIGFEVITFDRLLDYAKRFDEGTREINEKNM